MRIVSTAYSGMPSARATTERVAASGSPETSPARRARIDGSSSGCRSSARNARRPAPHPGRFSSSSGRARVMIRIGTLWLHSSMCSMKSSVPGSAQCRSSNRSATTPVDASRSKNVRHAENSSSAPPAGASPTPSRARIAGSIRRRSASSGTCSATISWIRVRVVSGSSVSSSDARDLTISPRAQNVIPSPYAGDRPSCHQTRSTTPSTYLRNSQASRLLPIPAWPVIETSRTRRSRDVAWNRSFIRRSSASRPTNGASSRSSRPRPRRWATILRARHAATGATLPLSSWSPACS